MGTVFDGSLSADGSWAAADMRARVLDELRSGVESGEGLDGRALELVKLMHDLPGENYTDGECLDLIGIVIDAWRGLDL